MPVLAESQYDDLLSEKNAIAIERRERDGMDLR
jgi:hypothetical protein